MIFRVRPADLPDDSAAILALAASAEAVDGVGALNEESRLAIQRGAGDSVVRVAEGDSDETIVGVLVDAEGDGAACDLVTHPEHRRRGVATALLAAEGENVERYGVWAHGDFESARALAEALGLERVRDLWQMTREVSPEETFDVELPGGFVARPFDGSDDQARAWLDVNAAAFVHHPEQGRMTMDDLRARMAEEWFEREGLILVWHEPSGELAASHWTKREPGSDTGEVYVVAVAPAYQGRGLAGPLTNLGLAHLAGLGVHEVELYVEGDNEPAKATYTRRGFHKSAQDVLYVHTGAESL